MSQITVNRDASMIAYEINIIKDQTNKYLLHSSIEIGRRLKEAKEMVGHGNWSKWLEDEVSYSQRTASNLIKINDEYGSQLLENPNSQALADLGYTHAVSLLKLDTESRDNFLIVHDAAEMSTRELESEIQKTNELKKGSEVIEKKLEEIQGTNDDLEKELLAKAKEIKLKETTIKQYISEIGELRKQVKNSTDNDSDVKVKKLQDEITSKKNRIIELENELLQKPKEVETQKIMYEVPEGVQKELEELRLKVGASENSLRFKANFDILMNQFNDLLEILDSIKNDEPDDYDKYKGAINKLLEKLVVK